MIPKFRAWHKEDKEMIEVGEMDFNLQSIYYNMANISFDEFDIMQYTGLNDINDNEIFEGDIVRYGISADEYSWGFNKSGMGIPVIISGMVSFLGSGEKVELTAHDLLMYVNVDLEIIGNVFENEYLIQEEE